MEESCLTAQRMSKREAELKNPLALAFVGDTVWDLLVRQRLLDSWSRVNALHKLATSAVNASAQSMALERIEPLLNETENDVVRRGFNAHCNHTTPKNQNPFDYRRATGLEALTGWLYLSGQHTRLVELFDMALPVFGGARAVSSEEAPNA